MGFADGLLFLRETLRSPRDVAAVAPSGKAPAALITAGIFGKTGPALELRPGTGVLPRP